MNEKKVITWKDADKLLCQIAALMLEEAAQDLRMGSQAIDGHPVEGGGTVEPGMAEDSGNRTWWSTQDPYSGTGLRDGPSEICWWSFQNIIRMRLKDARQQLKEALYEQNRALRNEKNRTRNPNGRKRGSKFGWSAEE